MRVSPLPKSWLIHQIIYEGYTGEKDAFQKPVYDVPIIINHVRYDQSTVFSRDSSQTKIVADGIIFVDATHSKPLPDFKEESKITFKGHQLTLKKVITLYYPTSDKVRHWELEVI